MVLIPMMPCAQATKRTSLAKSLSLFQPVDLAREYGCRREGKRDFENKQEQINNHENPSAEKVLHQIKDCYGVSVGKAFEDEEKKSFLNVEC